MLGCIRKATCGIFIDVHVVPGSKKTCFSYDDYTKTLRAKIVSRAMEGKANKELLSCFKRLFGNAEIYSGAKSRNKTLFVRGRDLEGAGGVLEKLIQE